MKKSKKLLAVEDQESPFLFDPYEHYYDRYVDEEEFEAGIDEYIYYEPDPVVIKEHIDSQIEEAKKERNKWLPKAMVKDPAFMLDPIEDYYKQLIPEEIRRELSESEIMDIVSIYDPVTWAERNLLQKKGGFKPRTSRKGVGYQSQMIRCKSKRIVARAGRRIGKSVSVVIRILHKAFTWYSDTKPKFNIIIFTPNQSQIDLLFKMMELFIDDNPELLSMIKGGQIPQRKTPFYYMELVNGVTIKGFVSGSSAIRGQAADMLIIDEASFLTKDDTDSVIALLAENKKVELWVSSTPKGLKDWFYERTYDPDFVSFYFPTDKFHPDWSYEMEQNFRSQLTESGYRHEVLADFSSDGEGVFQRQFVQASLKDYQYSDCKYNSSRYYGIGVDWNDKENGTQIYVVEYNPSYNHDAGIKPYSVVDRAAINIDGWTQTMAVNKIREFNKKWRASFIYVDKGHGGTQVELLHTYGMQASPNSIEKRLIKTKAVDFGSVMEIVDPWQKKKVKKQTKAFMVNNAVRVFEEFNISMPYEDDSLKNQLEGYRIDRINPNGTPVYAKDPKYGDHGLDALMLALFGFVMEFSSLAKPRLAKNIGSIDALSKKEVETIGSDRYLHAVVESAKVRDARLQMDKAREREELINARGGLLRTAGTLTKRHLAAPKKMHPARMMGSPSGRARL